MQCFMSLRGKPKHGSYKNSNLMWFIVILKQLTQTEFVCWQSNQLFIYLYTTTCAGFC